MITTTALAATLLMATPASAFTPAEADLGSDPLSKGHNAEAIAELEAVDAHDPAQLINLGIAYARQGDEAKARLLFREALTDNPMDLETADGTLTDSRRLARKAIRMLELGEFTPGQATRTASRVTLRD